MNDSGITAVTETIKEAFNRNLKYTLATSRRSCSKHELYLALAMAVRERLIDRWNETREARIASKAKRVYYLSLEFLIGRAMGNNIANLGLDSALRRAAEELQLDWDVVREEEVDAGLGNGGTRPPPPPAFSIRWPRCNSRQSATGCVTITACSISSNVPCC